MRNKVKIYGLLVIILVMFTGCSGGSYRITVGDIGVSHQKMSGKYSSFTGHYFKTIKIRSGETLAVHFSSVTKKGTLTASVINSEGRKIKSIETDDTVQIDKPGKYKLQVNGKKHKGHFTLSWKIE